MKKAQKSKTSRTKNKSSAPPKKKASVAKKPSSRRISAKKRVQAKVTPPASSAGTAATQHPSWLKTSQSLIENLLPKISKGILQRAEKISHQLKRRGRSR